MDGSAFVASRLTRKAGRRPSSVLMIGNYPPRRCGIATFTADVREALASRYPDASVDVLAMVDREEGYDFPGEVTHRLRQHDRDAYAAMGARLNEEGRDLILVQHEFGIFGGDAGLWLLELLETADAPVVTIMHTLLTDPDPMQREAMERLIARSERLIVMAERGRRILTSVYGVRAEVIEVVPHGAPDRPKPDPDAFKGRFGLEGKRTLFTFGLLSPNKGIEGLIAAMPAVVEAEPAAHLTILGATHPHLVKQEGEAYREKLQAQAEELGVADHIAWDNRFADDETLLDYLCSSEVYVSPYLNEQQITSGTLSYAVGLGRPVVSTPYWHAQELLADGCGELVPFRDPAALSDAIVRLLTDDDHREAISDCAYARGRETIWPRLAESYMRCFEDSIRESAAVVELRTRNAEAMPRPSLQAIEAMSDDVGLYQHSTFSIADRDHGYCVDDNARALMLAVRLADRRHANAALPRLTSRYAAFVNHAWDDGAGSFRNFMGFDRRWLEREGSDDSQGRSFRAVAETGWTARDADLADWAKTLTARALPHMERFDSPRTCAFVLLGLCAILREEPSHAEARRLAETMTGKLVAWFRLCADHTWAWFEDVLGYDNARLPQALLQASLVLDDDKARDAGLDSLEWLTAIQTADEGHFRAVGTRSFGVPRQRPERFDQQPLEATAQIEACEAAYLVTRAPVWIERAEAAFGWFHGRNDLGKPLAEPERGICRDGFSEHGVSRNAGAESLLTYQLSILAMERLRAAGQGGLRPRDAVAAE